MVKIVKLLKTKNILPSSNLLKLILLGPFKINWFKMLSSESEASLLGCMAIRPRFTNLSMVIDDLFHVNSLRSKLKLRSPSQLVTGWVSKIWIRRLISWKISWLYVGGKARTPSWMANLAGWPPNLAELTSEPGRLYLSI